MTRNWVRTALLGAAIAAAAVGCAEEREPINRVQPNALAKTFFVGDLHTTKDDPEFWTQATLVDVGYGAAQDGLFTSTYTQGVARVKWQITEDLLLARLTYERVANSDGKGAGPASTDGQIVAAFRIQSHFDIRRAYNPSTGEEMNVVEENGSDRPWYEREQFRVDWSENLNTDAYDFDTLSMMGLYGGVKYTPLAYYVNDPDDPDAPHFDTESGYFDVTNKVFAAPKQIDLSHLGWGIDAFPACMLPDELFGGSEPIGNCNPVEITLRQSFRKITDSDFEATNWDGFRFQAYGAFYVDRLGYARNYGMSDDLWHRFITKYNIWKRSHYYADAAKMTGPVECYTPETLAYGEDPQADGNADGTQDRCWMVTVNLARDAGKCGGQDDIACYNDNNWEFGGSRCDTYRQACTLPYRHRELAPVTWYYTNDSNQEYFDGTEWATHDHDVAMRHGVMVGRYTECMATSGNNKALCLTGTDGTRTGAANPVYFGQMDDHAEARELAREVDDCRHGLSHADFGAINSKDREARCTGLADPNDATSVIAARSAAGHPIDPAIGTLARMAEQITLCHSPVQHDDAAVCAPADKRLPKGMTAQDCIDAKKDFDAETLATCKAAFNVRRGDLRYHLVNVLEEPQTPSPWGIYTDAEDPLNGEKFSAAINVWSHVNDLWSQLVVDRIRFIKGELSADDVTDATNVHNWAQAADAAANGKGLASRVTKSDLTRRMASFANIDESEVADLEKVNDKALTNRMRKLHHAVTGVAAAADVAGHNAAIYDARRKVAFDSEVEAELVDPMMHQLAGTEGLAATGATLELASPLRMAGPHNVARGQNALELALAERGHCMLHEAPAPMALTGLADVLERKFENACASTKADGTCAYSWGKFGTAPACVPGTDDGCPTDLGAWQSMRAEVMRKYIAQRAHYAVIVHEMGHSVGERHNFVSSSDAMNYRPQYWQLRTNNGTNTTECKDYAEDGTTCVGPRWFDPMDKQESDNLLWMWMHSSVMDYAGEYTQDLLGLGAYDFGAHRMYYGDAVAVWDDASYRVGEPRSHYMFSKMDSFGGLLGFNPEFNKEPIHYSQYQKNYEFIKDCKTVDANAWKPASWDDATDGTWDSLLDGQIVTTGGQTTKCRQQTVDYAQWNSLRMPTAQELFNAFGYADPYYRGGPAVDAQSRIRVPYGFATDRWADLGNAAVYRHDNGADNYEVFDFLITQQEVNHIFDDYRRNRRAFSVRAASGRTLGRYNAKVRDGAKGLALLANVYKDVAAEEGYAYNSLWAFATASFFPDAILASTAAFDHFTRMFARPEPGDHGLFNGVLVSHIDAYAALAKDVTVPTGASAGKFATVSFNGKPIENRLSESNGEYDSEYVLNAGSYYDKAWTPYLMAESEDNFISDSRADFVDGRYRAVSLADLFPDGYRRWLANNLTGDSALKGVQIAGENNKPLVEKDDNGNAWPTYPLGQVSWWPAQTDVCYPATGTTICSAPGVPESQLNPLTPPQSIPMDPQVGWEQQKFLIAMSWVYLPSNQKLNWIDMMRVYQLGYNSDPGFDNRIEYHDATGRVWIAQTFGKEQLTHVTPARTVQRGIGARVIEYANELAQAAYVTTPGPDLDGDSKPDWYVPVMANGKPLIKYDSKKKWVGPNGNVVPGPANCSATDSSGCQCTDNTACDALERYNVVPAYMWESGHVFYGSPDTKGIYD